LFDFEFDSLWQAIENDSAIGEFDFRGFRVPRVNERDFWQKEIAKRLNLSGAVFTDDVHFFNTTFLKGADFSMATFKGIADFRSSRFVGNGEFYGVKFFGAAKFTATQFDKEAIFSRAVCADVDFVRTQFGGISRFFDATLAGTTLFTNAAFKGDAHFTYATFSGSNEFVDTEFSSVADFAGAAIRGPMRFVGRPGQHVFDAPANFSNLRERVELLSFEDTDLSRASFLGTNVESVGFRLVRWFSPRSARNRQALWDEYNVETGKTPEYGRIVENYRQLVLNYERRRDYATSDSFHIGEMEIYRRQAGARLPKWRGRLCRYFTLVNFYKLSSYYGTSYGRAFFVLACLAVVFFPCMFLLSGFQLSKDSVGGTPKLIEYTFGPDSQHHFAALSAICRDFGHAILMTLSILTFQRERFYEPVGSWSRFIVAAAALILPAQAALALLAVRRRFRR
jgi:uncharacterized protein YjbI with pentapeptide repeats